MSESSSSPPPENGKPALPSLPVVTLEPWEQRSNLEKYGAFWYLALGGLVILAGLILWFGWGVWSLREVWRDVYVLHDPNRGVVERVNAADRLARNPETTERQRYDIAIRRDLPDLARYLIAESLTAEAATGDPRAYAMAVARSEGDGWPAWFRLLMLRPLAYGSGAGEAIEPVPLRELSEHDDPVIRLWALYTLAEASRYNRNEANQLRDAANQESPEAGLAAVLVQALDAETDAERIDRLDEATRWVRRHHPGALAVWFGWDRFEGELVRVPVEVEARE
ncbi:hypothetical protein [Tautonia marina]|uniref:hypothetical protein n=1 Tax=Tautonia marina TaxID=2653855 RepID=UPI00137601BF|nr:hypothetical protein [Tautonia marina]